MNAEKSFSGNRAPESERPSDERNRLKRLRALLAVGLDQAERGELIELTPELLDEIDREVEEQFQRGEQPNPGVCP
jgi:hypothetical protein